MTDECYARNDQPPVGERAWYVIYAKPRQESLALSNLLNQGYAAWLPRHTAWRKLGGQWNKHVCPMFPRYLLMRPSSPRQGIGPVRSTPGVSAIVRFGGRFALMSEAVVEGLRAIEQQLSMMPSPDESPFTPGSMVRISDGPLRGLEGVVARVARDRVAILLSLLGRESVVPMAPGMLVHAR